MAATGYLVLFLTLTIFSAATSARLLDEQPQVPVVPPEATDEVVTPVPSAIGQTNPSPGVAAATSAIDAEPFHTLTFFMHDILGGSKPSAQPLTGIINNPSFNGQLPFAKPNGAVLPVTNGASQDNGLLDINNMPFLTGLGGATSPVLQNNGFGNFPVANGGQLPSASTLQQLMFGTMTVFDDELTEGHELRSGLVGKAQGFYVVCSEDGTTQTMAFTVMLERGSYADSLSFFGIHRTAVSESQLAIMGGTGKYVNAKGFATVKTLVDTTLHETDGVETLLEFTVYITY
ncbi:hypothetical protein F2P56_017075 [Juglans regia]|uniref:Dirigent protein n=2 Tax=Juglans regia TaxID=51240 RepID=A0A833XK42_JUGRE|nr:dirigent protein 25-like [Juglans regia]KAF5467227.1 hypothetical protein F2P56_017075 [Juglans regia]